MIRIVFASRVVAAAALWAAALGTGLAHSPQQPPHDPLTQMLPDARGALPWSLLSKTAIRKIDGKLGPDFPVALKP